MNFASIPAPVRRLGVALKRAYFPDALPREPLDMAFRQVYGDVKPFTMTTWERLFAAFQAIEHIVRSGIPGDVVECGVWRGGSSMLMARTLLGYGTADRNLWLYDTFAGMTEPTAADGAVAGVRWTAGRRGDGANDFCLSPFEEVRSNMGSTGYPRELVRFVQGPVEQTIPGEAPERIAVLRLDTDWYESTRHELEHLYPRLERGGVLILDDYGHWEGARRAVDEYFEAHGARPLLGRIDYTGRMGIKP